MNIVAGRGQRRSTFVFPHASIVNKSPVAEQEAARDMLCRKLGVPVLVVDNVT